MPETPIELHDVAAFDLGAADAQGDWVVYRDSVLFKPGDYKSHDFSMSPDEMRAAVEKVGGPIPNELEHVNTSGTATIIDDQLGDVTDVRLSEDGTELKGTVKIPRWLDQVWDKHLAKVQGVAKQVSCVWDRRDKSLMKLGLVVKGRVPGAALMAAFAEAHPEKAEFTLRKRTEQGNKHAQVIHDVAAAAHPAVCSPVMEPPTAEGMEPGAFADSPKQMKYFKKVHDDSIEHGADCPAKKSVRMSAPGPETGIARRIPVKHETEIRLALFGDKAADAPAITLTDEQAAAIFAVLVPAPASFASTPEGKAMAAEIAALKKVNEDNRKAGSLKDAARFSETLSKEGRIPPAIKALVSGLAVQLADDDHAAPNVVTFSDAAGKSSSLARVDALLAIFAALPKKTHETPTIVDLEGDSLESKWKVQFNTGHAPAKKDGEMTAEDEDTLLSSYPSGEGIVADRKKARAR